MAKAPAYVCPVCDNIKTGPHCESPTCLWFRCDKSGCNTIFDKAKRYIRNPVKT